MTAGVGPGHGAPYGPEPVRSTRPWLEDGPGGLIVVGGFFHLSFGQFNSSFSLPAFLNSSKLFLFITVLRCCCVLYTIRSSSRLLKASDIYTLPS